MEYDINDINELIFYKEQINEAVQWITNYKNNNQNVFHHQ